jgi:arabinose-5-phosphate isomerase
LFLKTLKCREPKIVFQCIIELLVRYSMRHSLEDKKKLEVVFRNFVFCITKIANPKAFFLNPSAKRIADAKEVLDLEASALQSLSDCIDASFSEAVGYIVGCKGRVVFTGMGKSAIIASKLAASFNSTGTPSLFMHAADAIHGDLGMVQEEDVVICLSKSGNTEEVKTLIPLIKARGNTLIGVSADPSSYLGVNATTLLLTPVEREACPHNLAPTTSTTLQLALGDALMVAALNEKNFTETDFARYHPGGSLGKKLYLKVSDLMGKMAKPEVFIETPILDVILEISNKMTGCTPVLSNQEIVGIITDGDIRRMLQRQTDINQLKAEDVMSSNPIRYSSNHLALDALKLMNEKEITQLIITHEGRYTGILHMHQLIQEGLSV